MQININREPNPQMPEMMMGDVPDHEPFDPGPPAHRSLPDDHLTTGAMPPPALTFEQILSGLRTEQDCFYFSFVGTTSIENRLALEGTFLSGLIGWDAGGESVTTDPALIRTPAAIIRKDWSGVIIKPHHGAKVLLNDCPLTAPHRLRQEDRLILTTPGQRKRVQLTFHEPSSLGMLDGLLRPQSAALPAAVALSAAESSVTKEVWPPLVAVTPLLQREFFGSFTIFELSLMGAGTIAGAILVFFALNAA